MATDKQIEASRRNGARSHGPVTPEGKQQSSRNATKHGLCSRRMLLPDESPEKLRELEIFWLRQLWPQTQAERELVLNVASAAWRMQRYERLEASVMSIEMATHPEDPEAAGRAFLSLANNGRGLDLINRYATRARHEFEHALATYHETVRLRRREMSHDRVDRNDDDYIDKWGVQPRGYSRVYWGQELDHLPNEPGFTGIIPDAPPDEDEQAA
jgi:hypothetical protein